ncbi:hypothetical protein MAM1_0006d00718 [Mucor ambiguus]|uniref:Uncharacterized protein n=1 Tax=Mucor ambiguus TaxID=91626 RepID=A0A0C9LQ82_9FUNG|nr:hypothetical protein MAM1_0006d00718 [Mucor ambiguus]
MYRIANEMALEQLQENVRIQGHPNVKLIFRADGTPDRRRYNRPANSNEVSPIIIGSENNFQETASIRDIVICHQRPPGVQFINEFNQAKDLSRGLLLLRAHSENPLYALPSHLRQTHLHYLSVSRAYAQILSMKWPNIQSPRWPNIRPSP